ncbi:MAG: autotransporter assembly complex protein TamA [Desulfohalobiaceae bacterium]|nr:autotransporter assembly complex protein TamA [Desulfohalobiaceae bacterium]
MHPLFALPAAAAGVDYTVSIQGIEDSGLLKELKKSTEHFKEQSVPLSRFFLEKKAENHLQRLLAICNAHGYYQAEAEVDIRKDSENGYEAIFRFDPGPVYQVAEVRIEVEPKQEQSKIKLPDPKELGIPKGSPALAADILQAKKKLQQAVLSQGYLKAAQDKPEVRVDDGSRSVTLVFFLSPGSPAKLGSTRIRGLEEVDREYIQNKIPWTKGDTYDPKLVQQLKSDLMSTRLFNMVDVQFADNPSDNGLLPVTIRVRERDRRSVRLGLGYASDIGPLGKAAWEHKNLLGQGEKLSITTSLSGIEQTLSGSFHKPNFFRPDQSLLLGSSLKREDYDSYQNKVFQTEANIQRQLSSKTRLSGGLGYKGQTTEDVQGSDRFHLFFVPGLIEWDSRDAILNPTKGLKIGLGLTPYQGISPTDLTFFKTTLTTRWYKAFTEEKDVILAFRTKLGSLSGGSTGDIPVDERFFAGGGGSVRGFPFQEISPQKDGESFGGKSVLEVSTELRWQFKKKFGLVFFVDGGQVTLDEYPDLGQDILWGAGLGLRYFTDLGPLRFDVAFPLKKEDHISDSVQFYISIGQAF